MTKTFLKAFFLIFVSSVTPTQYSFSASTPAFPSRCAEGLKNFPELKPWAEKLSNFVAPVDAGGSETSFFYGVGATWAGKNAAELWKKEHLTLDLSAHQKAGSIETVWLGPLSSATESWKRFWNLLLAPGELELLGRCQKDDCKIKFSDAELGRLTKVSNQLRVETFRDILQKRLGDYVTRGEVWSYEETVKPLPWAEMPTSQGISAQSPPRFKMPNERTTYGYEYLDAEPGKHKPVLALFNRSCEKRGEGSKAYTACSDIVLYNNHYFDFWARMIYFYPWCDGQIALVYETLDVDQIKGSRIVRILFGGQMRRSLETLVETRLNRIHVIGF